MLSTRTAFTLCIAALLSACDQTSTEEPQAPSLLRETKPAASTVSESITLPPSGHGNFGSLVADYESKSRAIWQKPDMVIAQLGDIADKKVADIGAGTGYFAFRMVPRAKHVIGIDIDQRFINFMDSVKVRLPETYQKRFETRLAKPDDPLLKPGEVDAIVIVNTYGYIENRVDYLTRLSKGLTAGGKLLIIDFKKNNLPIGPPENFKVAVSQVQAELKKAGFKTEKIDNQTLDYQYIILAEKIKVKD